VHQTSLVAHLGPPTERGQYLQSIVLLFYVKAGMVGRIPLPFVLASAPSPRPSYLVRKYYSASAGPRMSCVTLTLSASRHARATIGHVLDERHRRLDQRAERGGCRARRGPKPGRSGAAGKVMVEALNVVLRRWSRRFPAAGPGRRRAPGDPARRLHPPRTWWCRENRLSR
jgi:hypothetical protein